MPRPLWSVCRCRSIDGGKLVRRYVEYLVHFGDAQELTNIGSRVYESKSPTAGANRDVGANQFAQSSAIQKIKALKI